MEIVKIMNFKKIKGDASDREFYRTRKSILVYSKKNKYDLYLLLDIDIPWVKDDLRDRPNDRKLFFDNFKETLIKNHKPFKLISGNLEERLKKSINFVDEILLRKT